MEFSALSLTVIVASFLAGAGLMAMPLIHFSRRNDQLQSEAKQLVSSASEAQGRANTLEEQIKDREAVGEQANQAFRLAASEEIAKAFEPISKEVADIERARASGETKMLERIKDMREFSSKVSEEVGALTTALASKPHFLGSFGETLVERVLQAGGMKRNVNYFFQRNNEVGRPDFTVVITDDIESEEGRELLLDSKVSNHWLEYCKAETDSARTRCRENLIKAMRTQAKQLAAKDYGRGSKSAAGFVVMVVPDAALEVAMEHMPEMFGGEVQNGVVISGYATLLPLIKVVEMNWRRRKVGEEAKKIAETGMKLYERIAIFSEHFADLGQRLRQATEAYDAGVGSFNSGIVRNANDLKKQGVESNRDLAEPPTVDFAPRAVRDLDPVDAEAVGVEAVLDSEHRRGQGGLTSHDAFAEAPSTNGVPAATDSDLHSRSNGRA